MSSCSIRWYHCLMGRFAVGLLVLVLCVWSPVAAADTIAASLYEEGVALMKEKKFVAACEKLAASFEREQLSGTLMTLAQCHQLRGMTATAWDQYKRSVALAQAEGRTAYEERAKELAAELEPRLSWLKLELAPGARHEGLTIALGGNPVDLATLGVALAVDPGQLVIEASAPGYQTWSTSAAVGDAGQTVSITIPALTPSVDAPPVAPAVTAEPIAPRGERGTPAPQGPTPDAPDAAEGGVPAWAWIAGATGLALAGVSVGFLIDDLAAIDELRERCERDPDGGENDYLCDAGYDVDAANARKNRSGALALGFGIGAVAALTVSIIGIATAPDEAGAAGAGPITTVMLVPLAAGALEVLDAGGLALEGRF